MIRYKNYRILFISVIWLLLSPSLVTAAELNISINEQYQKYREIYIDVTGENFSEINYFQIWYKDAPFNSISDAILHSQINVGDITGLERLDDGLSYFDCSSDGQPIHRDTNQNPVISSDTKQWSCSLTGMKSKTDYWFAVIAFDQNDKTLTDINNLQSITGKTDVEDMLPQPPDTRPVLLTLISIVITLIAILIYFQRKDMKSGKASAKLAQAYVAPALIALALLSFYPICYGIYLAFTDAHQTHLGQQTFIGIGNFFEVLKSPGLLRVTLFTLVWAVANVSSHVLLGLLLAMVLTKARLKGKLFYRTVLLLPWAIPAYLSILAWRGILSADGLFNSILGTNIDLLSEVLSAQVLVIMVNIWLGVPFMMMSISGALMAIPQDMYEAARLEGISKWNQFRYLTLPNLKPTITPLALLGFIWSFNMFTVIYLMTRGNPNVGFGEPGATDILITYVYDIAFVYGNYGMAAAYSVLIFLMLVAFSWFYMKKTKATESVA